METAAEKRARLKEQKKLRMRELHKLLLRVKEDYENGKISRSAGICAALHKAHKKGMLLPNPGSYLIARNDMYRLFEKWPRFSGDILHPVPSDNEELDPQQCYMLREDVWDQKTKYGKNRLRLLNWMINRTSKY